MSKPRFLPGWLYDSSAVAERECHQYASRYWHPLAARNAINPGEALAVELLGMSILITHPAGHTQPQAFFNRCPHRGVALLDASNTATACKRLICPYHGWTYDLDGALLAAARESQFVEGFKRDDWPLHQLPCRAFGPWIWVAIAPNPVPLEQQLDLVLEEAADLFHAPRQVLARHGSPLACNWKVAHDNTLDDYHVAIAHPTTLHREQGPVRDYRHATSRHGNLLATPLKQGGTFYTFGLCPWSHLLLWPDQRMALINFLPGAPSKPTQCVMDVWLMGPAECADHAQAWLDEILLFLDEDRRLVESAQKGYSSGLIPGPPHQLEQRILQWQELYGAWMGLDHWPDQSLITTESPDEASGPCGY